LLEACDWQVPCNVTADSFIVWRNRQTRSPRTLNHYASKRVKGIAPPAIAARICKSVGFHYSRSFGGLKRFLLSRNALICNWIRNHSNLVAGRFAIKDVGNHYITG
jgi:hypothetical protein